MDFTVSNLDELLQALATEDCTHIVLSEDITIDKDVNIKQPVDIDLDGHVLRIYVPEGLIISSGNVAISNGSAASETSELFVVTGVNTQLTLGSTLFVVSCSGGNALHVKGRGKATVAGADIHGCVVVEGSGIAKDNSTLTFTSGRIYDHTDVVSVLKGGTFIMNGGELESDGDAIKIDGPRSKVEQTGGVIRALDESVVATNDATVELVDNIEEVEPETVEEPVEAEPEAIEEAIEEVVEGVVEEPAIPEPVAEPVVAQAEAKQSVTSGIVPKTTTVYGSPSNKKPVGKVLGPVTILSTKGNYTYIKYVLRGAGGRGVGYILTSAIK